jgi:hypothetical protein
MTVGQGTSICIQPDDWEDAVRILGNGMSYWRAHVEKLVYTFRKAIERKVQEQTCSLLFVTASFAAVTPRTLHVILAVLATQATSSCDEYAVVSFDNLTPTHPLRRFPHCFAARGPEVWLERLT